MTTTTQPGSGPCTTGSTTLTTAEVYWQWRRILGTSMGSPREYRAMVAHAADARWRPVIDSVYALDDYEAAIAATDPFFERPEIGERDLLSINYTSGTTARPKGVDFLPELARQVDIAGVRVQLLHLVTIAVSLALLAGVTWLLRATRFGRAGSGCSSTRW